MASQKFSLKILSVCVGMAIGGSAVAIPTTDGLVAYYSFDNAGSESSYVVDDSLNGHNGDILGGVSFSSGFSGNSAYFDGTGGIRINNSLDFNSTSSTISTYVKLNSTSERVDFIDSFDSSSSPGSGFELGFGNSGQSTPHFSYLGLNSGVPSGVTTQASAGDSLAANNWYHVTGVYDQAANESRLYLNGELVKTSVLVIDDKGPLNNDIYLGRASQGNEFNLDGQLDEVRIYNRALDDEEIFGLYASVFPSDLIEIEVEANTEYKFTGNIDLESGNDFWAIPTVHGPYEFLGIPYKQGSEFEINVQLETNEIQILFGEPGDILVDYRSLKNKTIYPANQLNNLTVQDGSIGVTGIRRIDHVTNYAEDKFNLSLPGMVVNGDVVSFSNYEGNGNLVVNVKALNGTAPSLKRYEGDFDQIVETTSFAIGSSPKIDKLIADYPAILGPTTSYLNNQFAATELTGYLLKAGATILNKGLVAEISAKEVVSVGKAGYECRTETSTKIQKCIQTYVSNSPSLVFYQGLDLGEDFLGISFDYRGYLLDADDFLVVAVDDVIKLAIDGLNVTENWQRTGLIDLRSLGENNLLAIGLYSDDPGKILQIQDIKFHYQVPEPTTIFLLFSGFMLLIGSKARSIKG